MAYGLGSTLASYGQDCIRPNAQTGMHAHTSRALEHIHTTSVSQGFDLDDDAAAGCSDQGDNRGGALVVRMLRRVLDAFVAHSGGAVPLLRALQELTQLLDDGGQVRSIWCLGVEHMVFAAATAAAAAAPSPCLPQQAGPVPPPLHTHTHTLTLQPYVAQLPTDHTTPHPPLVPHPATAMPRLRSRRRPQLRWRLRTSCHPTG